MNPSAKCDTSFGPTPDKVYRLWRAARQRYRLAAPRDYATRNGALEVATMVDAGDLTLDDVAAAFGHFTAKTHNDMDYRRWTLQSLARNLSQWIPPRKPAPVQRKAAEKKEPVPLDDIVAISNKPGPIGELARKLLKDMARKGRR